MTNSDKAAIIRRAMQNAKGDNLERTNYAFGNLPDAELDKQHGQSGQTRRGIWQGYKDDRAKWEEANAYLNELLEGRQ